MTRDVHHHPVECVVLARAKIRSIRAKIRLNRMMIDAYEAYQQEMEEVLSYLESRIVRIDPRDLVYATPPRQIRRRDQTPTDNNANNEPN